jgi:hypothetical protein
MTGAGGSREEFYKDPGDHKICLLVNGRELAGGVIKLLPAGERTKGPR